MDEIYQYIPFEKIVHARCEAIGRTELSDLIDDIIIREIQHDHDSGDCDFEFRLSDRFARMAELNDADLPGVIEKASKIPFWPHLVD